MRIWVDPVKLFAYRLSFSDITLALNQQNMQIAPGSVGSEPALPGQPVTYPLRVRGQLTSVAAFQNITLRANSDGSRVRLGDVARIERGLQSYAFAIRENGHPATAAAIQLATGANAVNTAAGIRDRLATLSTVLPEGMQFSVPLTPRLL